MPTIDDPDETTSRKMMVQRKTYCRTKNESDISDSPKPNLFLSLFLVSALLNMYTLQDAKVEKHLSQGGLDENMIKKNFSHQNTNPKTNVTDLEKSSCVPQSLSFPR